MTCNTISIFNRWHVLSSPSNLVPFHSVGTTRLLRWRTSTTIKHSQLDRKLPPRWNPSKLNPRKLMFPSTFPPWNSTPTHPFPTQIKKKKKKPFTMNSYSSIPCEQTDPKKIVMITHSTINFPNRKMAIGNTPDPFPFLHKQTNKTMKKKKKRIFHHRKVGEKKTCFSMARSSSWSFFLLPTRDASMAEGFVEVGWTEKPSRNLNSQNENEEKGTVF